MTLFEVSSGVLAFLLWPKKVENGHKLIPDYNEAKAKT